MKRALVAIRDLTTKKRRQRLVQGLGAEAGRKLTLQSVPAMFFRVLIQVNDVSLNEQLF
jgi:hypothetical protein